VSLELNAVYNMDCMEGMKDIPDNYFELAIVDPPYGIGINSQAMWTSEFKTLKRWDVKPGEPYFAELRRVSNNQIIWGGNYFDVAPSRCWLIWDKMNGTNDMADAEMAWTSFNKPVRMFRMHHFSKGYEKKTHPTQKPTDLYKWLLSNYAEPGDKILDTHVGSGSSIIACLDMGFDYMGFERDADYYEAMQDRIYHFTRQTVLEGIS